MADVQTANGHVQIANRLMEAIIEAPFTDRQVKVMLTLLRLTYGWRRKTVRMTEVELAERSGFANGTVKRAGSAFREDVALLLKNCVIGRRTTGRKAVFAWAINKNFEGWKHYGSPQSKLEAHWGERPVSDDSDEETLPDEVAGTAAISIVDETDQSMANWLHERPLADSQDATKWPRSRPASGLAPGHNLAAPAATSLQSSLETATTSPLRKEIERQEIQRTPTTTAVGAGGGSEEEQEATQYAGKMAAAMNAAITARWGEQPNIVRYTTGLQLAEDLVREGVSLDLACGAIASACARSKMPRPPSALEYMRNPIRQAVEEATQREFNAADTTPMAKRGGAPKAIGAAGDEEGERRRYDAERREAGMAWGKAHEPEVRAIELALNETYGALLTTSGFVRETRDKQLVIECAKRAGFPEFDAWKRTRPPPAPPPTLTLVQGGKPA